MIYLLFIRCSACFVMLFVSLLAKVLNYFGLCKKNRFLGRFFGVRCRGEGTRDGKHYLLAIWAEIYFFGIYILVDTYMRFLERGRELIAAQVVEKIV